MNVVTVILIGFSLYILGMVVGFVTRKWLVDRKSYSGIIFVTRDPDNHRILYSLELHDDPEQLGYMNEVVFKIDTSGENHETQLKHRV